MGIINSTIYFSRSVTQKQLAQDLGVSRQLVGFANGQRENTLVIFMSDHGELLGNHGNYLKLPYFYEPSVRVPLIINGPGVVPQKSAQTARSLSRRRGLSRRVL